MSRYVICLEIIIGVCTCINNKRRIKGEKGKGYNKGEYVYTRELYRAVNEIGIFSEKSKKG